MKCKFASLRFICAIFLLVSIQGCYYLDFLKKLPMDVNGNPVSRKGHQDEEFLVSKSENYGYWKYTGIRRFPALEKNKAYALGDFLTTFDESFGLVHVREVDKFALSNLEDSILAFNYNGNTVYNGKHFSFGRWNSEETNEVNILSKETVTIDEQEHIILLTDIDNRVFVQAFYSGSDYVLNLYAPISISANYSSKTGNLAKQRMQKFIDEDLEILK